MLINHTYDIRCYLPTLIIIAYSLVLSGCSQEEIASNEKSFNDITFYLSGDAAIANWQFTPIPKIIKRNNVLELVFSNNESISNRFDYKNIRLSSVFIDPTGREYPMDGFYDGQAAADNNHQWKLRFLPEKTGVWHYKIYWSNQEIGLKGKLVVTPDPTVEIEHLTRPQRNQRYLKTISGTPFYWIGGKWISANNYGPAQKNGQYNNGYLSNEKITQYLDTLVKFKHNGILVKTGLFPLEDGGYSWDLTWVHRAEWIVEQALQRNMYVQLNIFDTWSRSKGSTFEWTTQGGDQVFNVWDSWFYKPTDSDKIENYIRTIVARFSSYPNVFWELGNEMGRSPNCGRCFVKLANRFYLPWLRKFDPYNLPVAVSEDVWKSTDVDIALGHQTNKSILSNLPNHKPFLLNELVRSDDSEVLWKDKSIRNSRNRLAYRRSFWRVFMNGGNGASEATWLDINEPLNDAVLNVMSDHMNLFNFIQSEALEFGSFRQLELISVGAVEENSFTMDDISYYSYLLERESGKGLPENLSIRLPAGRYKIRWYYPSNGKYQTDFTLESIGSTFQIDVPETQMNDIVLHIQDLSARKQ